MRKDSLLEWLSVYLKGVAMGCAHAIPGVSGGTIALITGIYERLITAITSISIIEISGYIDEVDDYSLSSLRELLHKIDMFFLTVLGLGIITAVVSVLRAANFLIINFPIITYGFLTGLIGISAVILYREVDLSENYSRLAAVTGFLFAFSLSGYLATSLPTTLSLIFISGLLAVSALILPGISGSLVLVIMGQYAYMAAALSEFIDSIVAVFASGNLTSVFESAPPVIVFLAGAITGLFTVSHVVKWAMGKHRKVTMAFLVSLILGGLRAPIAETDRILADQGVTWFSAAPDFVLAAVFGAIIILILDRYTAGIKME